MVRITTARVGIAALALAGCSDFDLLGQFDPSVDPDDTSGGPGNPAIDVNYPPVAGEWCNGLDDNDNGEIDEGFPDLDADGVADCIDSECEVRTTDKVAWRVDPECAPGAGLSDDGLWDTQVEWAYHDLPWGPFGDDTDFPGPTGPNGGAQLHVITPPAVADLTGDGEPEIVFVAIFEYAGVMRSRRGELHGALVALDGIDGTVEWIRVDEEVIPRGVTGVNIQDYEPGIYWRGGVAVADVDGDGGVEVLAYAAGVPFGRGTVDRVPVAFDGATGALEWGANYVPTGLPAGAEPQPRGVVSLWPQVTVGDLDGDGVPEVLADELVLDGRTGFDGRRRFNVSETIDLRMAAVGDIDLDGLQEACIGNGCFDFTDRTEDWYAPLLGQNGHWNAIVDADGDPEGEVVMIANGSMFVLDDDGTLLASSSSGRQHPGAPCVADFDGDGEAEVGWGSNDFSATGAESQFQIFNLDGTEFASYDVADYTGYLAGCAGFDFDGDGTFEAVYSDNDDVRIFQPSVNTKSPVLMLGEHRSTTIWEYPSIADVDLDGSAELVIPSNSFNGVGSGSWSGVTVVGHPEKRWMPAAPVWPVHDFAMTNVLDDGSVPAEPVPSWQRYNVYRTRTAENRLYVDLLAEVVDVCASGCLEDDMLAVSVRVGNQGVNNSDLDIPVALYVDRDGGRELLAVQRLPERVPAGSISATLVFEVALGDVLDGNLVVVPDDDGRGGAGGDSEDGQVHLECDEANNPTVYTDLPCR